MKPVLTYSDVGDSQEIIQNGVTGFLLGTDPGELAKTMDWLMADPRRAAAMGQAGYQRIQALGISWDRVAQAILQEKTSGLDGGD